LTTFEKNFISLRTGVHWALGDVVVAADVAVGEKVDAADPVSGILRHPALIAVCVAQRGAGGSPPPEIKRTAAVAGCSSRPVDHHHGARHRPTVVVIDDTKQEGALHGTACCVECLCAEHNA
jgi:hypothetical protein